MGLLTKIKKEIYLNNLPKCETKKNKGGINWKESIGYKVEGIYDGLKFEVQIIKYESKGQYLSIKYKDKKILKIKTGNFSRCQLGKLLKGEIYKHNYNENDSRRISLKGLPLSNSGIDWVKVVNNKIKIPFIYDDIKGKLEIINYDGKYLYVKYLNKELFKISTGSLLKCRLGKLLKKYTNEFKIEIGTRFKDCKRDIIITDREYRRNNNGWNIKWYKYKCNKCGWEEGWLRENQLLKGIGCACCRNWVTIEGINDIPTTASWMIPYFQGGYNEAKLYTKNGGGNSNNRYGRIYPKCPCCGKVKTKMMKIHTIYKYHSVGCACGDGFSYPSKIMFSILEQLKLNFETEYSPDWCKYEYKNKLRQGKYDFYFKLNNKKYIVEIDGSFHSKDNRMNGQTVKESKYIDNFKDKLANEHNIEMIRIDCQESDLNYIKNNEKGILNSKLNNLFDLSKVNWTKCEEFALKNRILETCKLKRDNPEYTTLQIGNIMKLNRATIIKYLKQGTKIWDWVNYNPKEESFKAHSKTNAKLIEIFNKEGKSLGVFESVAKLARQSEELFGIKLNQSGIYAACNHRKQSTHKGFTFKYIN